VSIKDRLPPATISYMKVTGSCSFANFSGLHNEIRRMKFWKLMDPFVAARQRKTVSRWIMSLLENNVKCPDAKCGHSHPYIANYLCADFPFFHILLLSPMAVKKPSLCAHFSPLWNTILRVEKREIYWCLLRKNVKSSVAVHASNPKPQEAEAGGSCIWGWPCQHCKF
jgi:hypothetical protein